MESGWYILGEECRAFEKEFAAFLGLPHALGVANGTDAVELALRACGVTAHSLVVTVSHTAVATVSAIERIGATPVLVDVDESSYTMSPQSLQETLDAARAGSYGKSARISAVVPVHLYGQCADMDALLALAGDIPVIEDCAQAHGARYKGKIAGSMGQAASFSFYPTKNLGAFGDGGAVCTSRQSAAEQVALLRQYGWKTRYESCISGVNSRLDELQSAFLRVRLRRLERENARRRALAALYAKGLSDIPGLRLPKPGSDYEHVYHLYVVRLTGASGARDRLAEHLRAQGMGTGIHYPLPVHQQEAYAGKIALAPSGLPATEALCPEILSLPMYPGLNDEDVARVCAAIRAFF